MCLIRKKNLELELSSHIQNMCVYTHTHTHTHTHTQIFNNKKLSNCFPKWLYCFLFSSAVCERFRCFSSLLTLGIFSLFFFFWLHWVFVAVHRLSLVAVQRLLIAMASLVASPRAWALRRMGFSSCGLRALEPRIIGCGLWDQLPRSMWDLPRRGIEPVSLTLQGRFLTTGTSGKPLWEEFKFFSTYGAIQTFYFFGYPFW